MTNPTSAPLMALGECPPGLFQFGDTLGFKSEYKTESEAHLGFWQSDAYVVESGEYFWGGVSDARERERLLVRPLDYDDWNAAHSAVASTPSEDAERLAKIRAGRLSPRWLDDIEFLLRQIEERDAKYKADHKQLCDVMYRERDALRATIAEQARRLAAQQRTIGELLALPAKDDTLWRHKVRGTTYRILGVGRAQCPADKPLQDDEMPLVYQDIDSGALGVRRSEEFHDGRFERVGPRPTPATSGETPPSPADLRRADEDAARNAFAQSMARERTTQPPADLVERNCNGDTAEPSERAMSIAQKTWYEKIDGKAKSPGWIILEYAAAIDAALAAERADAYAQGVQEGIEKCIEQVCRNPGAHPTIVVVGMLRAIIDPEPSQC